MPWKNMEAKKIYAEKWLAEHPNYMTNHHRNWRHRTGRQRSMKEFKGCSAFLGVHVAERALSRFFDTIQRMPYNNPGYDFLCGKGYKIDVKSACLSGKEFPGWSFIIRNNTVADYFLCLAFDNREFLNPLHVWLIPSEIVNHLNHLHIRNSNKGLSRFVEYERPLHKVVACCTEMKGNT